MSKSKKLKIGKAMYRLKNKTKKMEKKSYVPCAKGLYK